MYVYTESCFTHTYLQPSFFTQRVYIFPEHILYFSTINYYYCSLLHALGLQSAFTFLCQIPTLNSVHIQIDGVSNIGDRGHLSLKLMDKRTEVEESTRYSLSPSAIKHKQHLWQPAAWQQVPDCIDLHTDRYT